MSDAGDDDDAPRRITAEAADAGEFDDEMLADAIRERLADALARGAGQLSIAALAIDLGVNGTVIVQMIEDSHDMFLDGDDENLAECFVFVEEGEA